MSISDFILKMSVRTDEKRHGLKKKRLARLSHLLPPIPYWHMLTAILHQCLAMLRPVHHRVKKAR